MALTKWPTSIRGINVLPAEQKHAIYRELLPDSLFSLYGLNLDDSSDDSPSIDYHCPTHSRAVEISVKHHVGDIDPMLYINLADNFANQLMVLLVIVNDLESPRFDIDVDEEGNQTQFGTTSRNIKAELAAMKAGLSPGQVRKGLRVFRQSIPFFEKFVTNMGHDIFFIEPLTYANAIVFERYGFNYLRGAQEMRHIHDGFQPGGELYRKLTVDGSPFRPPSAWQTVRGRAWAIHDGILDHPFTGFQMYKRVGKFAEINTFPNAKW